MWLQARLTQDNWQWLQTRLTLHRTSNSLKDIHISLGMVPRKLGRADLNLSDAEIDAAKRTSNDGWDATQWSVDTAARILILCTVAEKDEDSFGQLLTGLCRTADLNESITFYRGIALFPHSQELDTLVGEGLRTHIRAVFEAIAHNSAYPQHNFDQNRWNHMVLKALFIDSTLYPIRGLDERANAELARILCDYAHERWAAKRPVTPELWRCVGPFAHSDMLDDLIKVAHSNEDVERQAALLALSQCSDPAAKSVLAEFPLDADRILRGELNWNELSESLISLADTTIVSGENT